MPDGTKKVIPRAQAERAIKKGAKYEGEVYYDSSRVGCCGGDAAQTSGGGNTGDYLLPKLYFHFQFGGKADFNIDSSTLDFSNTSQKELGLTGIKVGESRGVNLFNSGINSNSLAFGNLTFTSQGNNQFSITSNMFDFDYQEGSSFGRNFGTFIGGAVFEQFYTIPVTPYSILRNTTGFGGSFNVIFNGNATVPK